MQNYRGFNLTETQKGFVYIIGGVLVLLYAFNFFQHWLNVIVIIGGILLLLYGLMKTGGIEKIRSLFFKNK